MFWLSAAVEEYLVWLGLVSCSAQIITWSGVRIANLNVDWLHWDWKDAGSKPKNSMQEVFTQMQIEILSADNMM